MKDTADNHSLLTNFYKSPAPSVSLSPTIMEKLTILTDAAKYDVACTSSGVDRGGDGTDRKSVV